MAVCCKKQGKTLCDRLHELYAEYGYYYDAQASYKLQGIAGKEKIQAIMTALREQKAIFIPEPAEVLDFAKGIAGLQAMNLLKYKMKNGSWIAIRPSGTEPKLKMYCSLVEKDEADEIHGFVGACCLARGVLFLRMWYNDGVRICFKKGILT